MDGDEITFEFHGFSYGVIFNEETDLVYWNVPYDYIYRTSNFFYDFLNNIRVESYFIGKEESIVDVTVCGKSLCSTESVELIVYNTNRAPEIINLYNQSITETEYLDLFVEAVDADGDIIKYSFTEPLNKKEGDWQTNYEDAGEQIIYVTASDGDLTDTKAITINVENVNREPSITTKYDELRVNEGQEFMFTLDISDPDNDNLTLTLENIPEGASFSDSTFLWQPNFDTFTLVDPSAYSISLRLNSFKYPVSSSIIFLFIFILFV